MKASYGTALVVGAISGLVLAMGAMLFVGATGGIPKLEVIVTGSTVEPSFVVPVSAMWIVGMIAAAVCGIVLAVVTRGVTRAIDPDSRGASLLIVVPLGAFVAAVLTFAVVPLGVTLLGSIADGNATISIVGLAGLTATVGIVAGAMIVWLSYILSRPPVPQDDPELLAA